MAVDHNTRTGTRSDNTTAYVIGTIIVLAIIGMLYYAFADRTSTAETSSPVTNTQTVPRTATPPASTTPTTTTTTPAPTPSTR